MGQYICSMEPKDIILHSNLAENSTCYTCSFYKYMYEMGRACSTHKKTNAYRILVGKPERKRPLGRPRRRWEDNIRMDLREIGWGGMDWTDLAQDRDQWRTLMNMVINLRVP
jgi:hypothetical protein